MAASEKSQPSVSLIHPRARAAINGSRTIRPVINFARRFRRQTETAASSGRSMAANAAIVAAAFVASRILGLLRE
ncbi:MAG: hypothetical protein H0W06_09415, partial [Chloroflexia bacterium]|nr:hypothetical protein [Chloroflexia bacterium]